MTIQEVKKELKREIRSIEREVGKEAIELWDKGVQDTHDMDGDEAYTRGYYRACQMALQLLDNTD